MSEGVSELANTIVIPYHYQLFIIIEINSINQLIIYNSKIMS